MSAARRTSRCNPRRPNLQPWATAAERHREKGMSHIDPQVDPEVLADIRRAAFELGEIYLEEFGDLDGAEHEFRAVLHAVPGLPAAELGLARVLHESGDQRGEL